MARHIKDLLVSVLPMQQNWKFCLLQQWDSCIGDLKVHVRLEKINDDHSLLLSVSHSSWLQELYYLSDIILKKINSNLAYPYVKKLRFKYSPRSMLAQQLPKIASLTPQHTHILTKTEQQALEKLGDPQLREALKQFLLRCYKER